MVHDKRRPSLTLVKSVTAFTSNFTAGESVTLEHVMITCMETFDMIVCKMDTDNSCRYIT